MAPKLFYVAAYAENPARAWDTFVVLTEADLPALAKAMDVEGYAVQVVEDRVRTSSTFKLLEANGYTIQRIREMKTSPPIPGICGYYLLDSAETVGEWWARQETSF